MTLIERTLRQDTPKFWRNLGRFVQQFADAEYYSHLLLWELVGIESGVAAAVSLFFVAAERPHPGLPGMPATDRG